MVICGFHAVQESLRSGIRGSLLISRSGSRIEALKRLAEESTVAIRVVPATELEKICGHDRHQGVALIAQSAQPAKGKGFKEALAAVRGTPPLILLLDELNDPHNLGAVLRSADQLAVDLVVIPSRRSVSETESVLRASAGASRYVQLVTVVNLVQALELCKDNGYWIYGADLQGQRADSLGFDGPVALVMGAEYRGLRRLVREHCDFLVRIPARGRVDSYNVSVATAILLYEIRRQQGFPGFA